MASFQVSLPAKRSRVTSAGITADGRAAGSERPDDSFGLAGRPVVGAKEPESSLNEVAARLGAEVPRLSMSVTVVVVAGRWSAVSSSTAGRRPR